MIYFISPSWGVQTSLTFGNGNVPSGDFGPYTSITLSGSSGSPCTVPTGSETHIYACKASDGTSGLITISGESTIVGKFTAKIETDSNGERFVGGPNSTDTSIASAISNATSNSYVYISPVTYNEGDFNLPSNVTGITITSQNATRPLIKGSTPVTGWTQDGTSNRFYATWSINSQEVFVDSIPLQQIGPAGPTNNPYTAAQYNQVGTTKTDMTAGSFFYDSSLSRLYVWTVDSTSPVGHLIEAGTRTRFFIMNSGSNNITISNIDFKYSNTTAATQQNGAIEFNLGTNCVLRNCSVTYCDFAGIGLGRGTSTSGNSCVRCTFDRNGCVGIQGSGLTQNFMVDNCISSNNNFRGFLPSWHSGGLKFATGSYGNTLNSQFYSNTGPGIWFDSAGSTTSRSVIDSNLVHDNSSTSNAGIMLEASDNITVRNNLVYANSPRGIYVSGSTNIGIFNNTIEKNSGSNAALDISADNCLSSGARQLRHVRVSNNIIANNLNSKLLQVVQNVNWQDDSTSTNGSYSTDVLFSYNLLYYSSATLAAYTYNETTHKFSNGTFATNVFSNQVTWAHISSAGFPLGTTADSVESDPSASTGFVDFSNNDFHLNSTSPAKDAGTIPDLNATPPIDIPTLDMDLQIRPQGISTPLKYDLGAYERVQGPSG